MAQVPKADQVFTNNESGNATGITGSSLVVPFLKFGCPLIVVFLPVLVGMTLYETCKQFIFHDVTIWQPHSMTVHTVAIGSTVMGCVLLRRQGKLLEEVLLKAAPRNPEEEAWQ
jgi:hypothetical protein